MAAADLGLWGAILGWHKALRLMRLCGAYDENKGAIHQPAPDLLTLHEKLRFTLPISLRLLAHGWFPCVIVPQLMVPLPSLSQSFSFCSLRPAVIPSDLWIKMALLR